MNKRMMTLIAILGIIYNTNAQISFGKPSTEILIENTIKESFVIVEQQYRLKEVKTGDYYGRNNKDEFGSVYSLGIVTKGGLVVDDRVIHPWEYDTDYDRYKSNKKYQPSLYITKIRKKDRGFRKLDCDVQKSIALRDSIFEIPSQMDSIGISIADTSGMVDGWFLWVKLPSESVLGAEADLSFSLVTKKEFEIKEDVKVTPPETMDKLIGGFFVMPVIHGVGSISFKMCGMAYKTGNEWLFKPVTKSWCGEGEQSDQQKIEDKPVKEDQGNDVLTPSEKGKKGHGK